MALYDILKEEEKEFIRKHLDDMTIGEMALSLGRSYFTVQKYTDSIGYHRYHRWTEEEDKVLIRLWGLYGAEYIARCLNLDANCVYNRVRRLKKNGKLA